jgi:hypothetical protein
MPLDVKIDYGAQGDKTADDTKAFQNALNDAGENGDVVFVPPGTYRIEGTLAVPGNVTLEGVWKAPPFTDRLQHKPADQGSVLLAYASQDDLNGPPFINLSASGAGLKGLTIFYPEQGRLRIRSGFAKKIFQYPPTILGGNSNLVSDNLSVQDVMLVNPYSAIDFATYVCGRHFIRGVYGQPLRVGIQIDHCLDIGRIQDIHFWPFWDDTAFAKSFTASEGVALVLRRSDWQIVHNFFGLAYHSGILFGGEIQTPGGQEGEGCNGQFSNINLDGADVGLDIYTTSGAGIHFSNLNIACTHDFGQSIRRGIWSHAPIPATQAHPNSLCNIVNGSFWGTFGNEAVLWEQGPLNISSSLFRQLPQDGTAIRLVGGNAILTGNRFEGDVSAVAVALSQNAGSIIAHNNLGGLQIAGVTPELHIIKDNIL